MRTPTVSLLVALLVAFGVGAGPVMGQSSPGYNILPNAGFTRARSGYAPDWWNWYNALGNESIKLSECWRLVDEHHVPDTRAMRLADGAQLQTSYLRIYFAKGMTLTLSAYLKSDRPNTKVNMYVYHGGWNAINEITEVTVGPEWERRHVTATTKAKSRSGHNFVRIGLAGPGTLWVNAPQLEEGNTPTLWKPSPKDTAGKPEADVKAPEPKLRFTIPNIDCVKIDAGPVIDGRLEDAAWKNAGATARFARLDEDKPAEYSTDAYICRDDENVYVAFRCHEPEMAKLTVKATLYDQTDLFQDDCVEVFISGNEDGSDYVRFAANARGTKVDSKGHAAFFDAEWQCAAHKAESFWSVEFRVPFSSLEPPLQPGSRWRLNLARFRARPKKEEYSAWAPVVRTFHDSEHFGFLQGVVAEVSPRSDSRWREPGAPRRWGRRARSRSTLPRCRPAITR